MFTRKEIDQLAEPQHAVYHGPNNIDNFEKFSIDALVTEFKQYAPSVYKLLAEVGGSSSYETEDQSKVVTVLSTLVKHHSKKALGVQLLTSYMMLSRGTSRQVNLKARYIPCSKLH